MERSFLGKLIVPEILKNFFTFYAHRRFITVFAKARRFFLSWSMYVIQSTIFCPSFKLLATPRHSKWSLFFKLLHQNSACVSDLPHTSTSHKPRPFADQCRSCSCTMVGLWRSRKTRQCWLLCRTESGHTKWQTEVTSSAVPAVISAIFSLRPLPCVSVITGFISRRSPQECQKERHAVTSGHSTVL
jgi:hypothetical protein